MSTCTQACPASCQCSHPSDPSTTMAPDKPTLHGHLFFTHAEQQQVDQTMLPVTKATCQYASPRCCCTMHPRFINDLKLRRTHTAILDITKQRHTSPPTLLRPVKPARKIALLLLTLLSMVTHHSPANWPPVRLHVPVQFLHLLAMQFQSTLGYK